MMCPKYQRVEGMEKAIQRGSDNDPSRPGEDTLSMSFEAFSSLPEELSSFPPSDAAIFDLVNVYFRLLGDSFFMFLHEKTFMTRMNENSLPKSLLYAVCAVSAKFICSISLLSYIDFTNHLQSSVNNVRCNSLTKQKYR
jgi:hypothetical protein